MAPKQSGRFHNIDDVELPGFGQVMKWMLLDSIMGRRRRAPSQAPVPVRDEPALIAASDEGALWLGHATALLRLGGLNILTDPVFNEKLTPVTPRNVPVLLSAEALPQIDLVLISHNHRDHLDRASIEAIENCHRPHYVMPLEVDRWLLRWGLEPDRISTLDWWEKSKPLPDASDVEVTCVPAQHWSQRDMTDKNKSLWGGFVLESGRRSVYFAGDSGYCSSFRTIGERFPSLDLALIPIGAYEPEWFMQTQHVNPEQALQAFSDCGAERMLSIHWGTYKLTDEPLDEPPERLEEHRQDLGLESDRVLTLPVGGNVIL